MKYLLDTHVLLWVLFEPHKLSLRVQQAITGTDHQKYVSPVSIWEICLKYKLGKLDLLGNTPEKFLQTALERGYILAPLDVADIASSYHLADVDGHRDPFDRMLIWQAICQDVTLLTQDDKMPDYTAHGLKIVS